MKKVIWLTLLCLVISSPLLAGKTSEVSLRTVRQGNIMRIILDADENFVNGANTITSLSYAEVAFPGEFELKKTKEFIFSTTTKGRLLTIQLKDVVGIKAYKLSSPSRLVIDMTMGPKQSSGPAQKSGTGLGQNQPAGEQKPGAVVPPNATAPLIQPSEKSPALKVFVIDAGHGGYDLGLISQEIREKDVSLSIAKDLGKALSKKGLSAYLTRKADLMPSLSERIIFANNKNPELFISIHCTPTDNRFAVYVSTYEEANVDAAVRLYSLYSRQDRYLDKSRSFARALAHSLNNEFKQDVVMRELPLPVLNSMNAPAVMVEVPGMKSYASDQKMRNRLVNSILAGINAYEQ